MTWLSEEGFEDVMESLKLDWASAQEWRYRHIVRALRALIPKG